MKDDVDLRSELRLISLCTGGGGLDHGVGLALPGARSVVLIEREAYAISRLVQAMEEGRLAPAPIWTDARTFNGRRWRGRVDGLIGGVPCQPHSLAGKRGGSEDERDLWSPTRRIIAQARPGFVLIENVGGFLSAGADEVAGAERVWRDLQLMGFQVEGGLFTAAEVGFSHLRPRVFILGVANAAHRDGWGGERGAEAGVGQGAVGRRQPAIGGADVAEPAGARPQGRGSDAAARSQRSAAERGGGALADADISQLRRQPSAGQLGEHEPDDGPRARHAGPALVDPVHRDGGGWPDEPQRGQEGRGAAGRPSADDYGISPPRPSDLDAWRTILADRPDLAPATAQSRVRGVADRVERPRIDELRIFGNGVVPLVAGFAVRTLSTRLAARGSAGAERLVRMMAA